MWSLPNDLRSAGQQIDTNAVAGASTTTALVGAPGVGIQLRVWGWKAGADHPLAGKVFAAMVDSGSANTSGYLALSDTDRADSWWLPGGLLLPANRGISLIHRSNPGAQRFFIAVFYTVE